jgi:hypothetical protein
MSTEPTGGGGTLSGKIGPLPAWGWAVGLGGLVGLVWFLRSKGSSGSTPAPDPSAQTTSATPTGTPTDFIPVDQGMRQSQFDQIMRGFQSDKDMQQNMLSQLLAAIGKLQGQPSAPPPSPTPTPIPVDHPHQPSPVPTPAPKPPPPPQQQPGTNWYTSRTGDTYSGIAARYGRSWQDLWAYQLEPGIRPADTQAELRRRGPDHALFNGSSVAIPGNWQLR